MLSKPLVFSSNTNAHQPRLNERGMGSGGLPSGLFSWVRPGDHVERLPHDGIVKPLRSLGGIWTGD